MALGQLIYINQDIRIIDPRALNPFDAESASADSDNRNALEYKRSRPVTDFLRDLLQSYVKLELLPGPIVERWYEFHQMKRLYLEHGWPNNFDGPGSDAAKKALREQEVADFGAGLLLEKVASLERLLKFWGPSGGSDDDKKNAIRQDLQRAKEAVKEIPVDVTKRQEEREQEYEADHPFY